MNNRPNDTTVRSDVNVAFLLNTGDSDVTDVCPLCSCPPCSCCVPPRTCLRTCLRTCCRRSWWRRRRDSLLLLTSLVSCVLLSAGAAAVAVGGGCLFVTTQQKPGLQARNWATWGATKFPASCNFPDIAQHNNVMADVLRNDPSVSNRSRHGRRTAQRSQRK